VAAEPDDRARALDDIVAVARQHGIGADEIASALGNTAAPARRTRARSVLIRVLGFLGGTFIFAGIAAFIAMQWTAMNAPARVVVTLGSGIAAFVLALLAYREARFERAAAGLLLTAAALEPTGMLVAFDEFGSGGDWRIAILATAGTIAAQFGLTFGSIRRSTPLFLCLLFGVLFALTAMDLADVDGTIAALTLGGSLVLASVGISRTAHRDITPPWYFAGSAAFLGGLFDAIDGTPVELLFLLAAAAFVYLSVVVRSRTLLFVATLAILAYTGYFTAEHFADSFGWPLTLVAFGLLMIGLSALAWRIDQKYVRGPRAAPPSPG
jgi:hypothetical protein